MPARRKFSVYLAGPISHCNEKQKSRWRDEVKSKFGSKMTFVDPMETWRVTPYEIVEADRRCIEQADGLLANMWRESIGTAMGIAHAYQRGRPIVVADPNHLESKMLSFFADAVEETPAKGAKALFGLLQAEFGWQVVKAGGRKTEGFERRKILDAVRSACRQAKRDDVTIPGLVLPRVIERLQASDRRMRKSVTTTDIRTAVTDVLEQLGGDPLHADAVTGVLNAWHSPTERAAVGSPGLVRERLTAADVPVSCGKSHATIWGKTVRKIDDIPAPAKGVFQSISSVLGITRITLGRFGHKEKRSKCQAMVMKESRTPCVIEGKLYDNGPKGTMQSFKVRVQSDAIKKRVAAEIEHVLRETGTWACSTAA